MKHHRITIVLVTPTKDKWIEQEGHWIFIRPCVKICKNKSAHSNHSNGHWTRSCQISHKTLVCFLRPFWSWIFIYYYYISCLQVQNEVGGGWWWLWTCTIRWPNSSCFWSMCSHILGRIMNSYNHSWVSSHLAIDLRFISIMLLIVTLLRLSASHGYPCPARKLWVPGAKN